MKKKIILPAIIFLFSTLHAATGTMKIMIQPFSNTQKMQKHTWISAAIEDTITSDFLKIKNISVITEEARKNAVKEIQMGMTGLVDEKSAVRAGKMTGANILVTGKYTVLGNNIRVVAKMVDVTRGQVIKSAKLDGTIQELFSLQDKIVTRLLAEVEKIDRRNIPKIIISKNERTALNKKVRPNDKAYRWYARGLALKGKNPQKALLYLEKAIDLDPNFGKAYRKAAYLSGIRLGNFKKGKKYIINASKLYKKQYGINSVEYAEIYLIAGLLFKEKGSYKKALEGLNRSRKILEEIDKKDSREYGRVLMNIGNVYIRLARSKESIKYFKQCDAIYRRLKIQKTTTYATLLLNTGVAYLRIDPDKSIAYMMDAQKVYQQLNIFKSLSNANLMLNLGVAYSKKNDFDRSISLYEESLELRKKLRLTRTSGYASALSSLGSCYYKKKNYKLALQYWNATEKLLEEIKKTRTTSYAIIKYNKGLLLMRQGKFIKAAESLESAYRIYSATEYKGKSKDIAREKAAEARKRAGMQTKKNLVKNGSFEKGMRHWGTSGQYENRGGNFRGFWGKAQATASIDSREAYSLKKSLYISNSSRKAPHVYRTLAQRVNNLKRNTRYRLSFRVMKKNCSPSTLYVTTTPSWDGALHIKGGSSSNWEKYEKVFSTENRNYMDIRMISGDRGSVWIDEIKLVEE